MDDLDRLNSRLKILKSDADRHKKRYWELRLKVIQYLGGKCACGESDVTALEIHHDPPCLTKRRPGGVRMKEWKAIIAGEMPAKLCCHNCHIDGEHNGNTNALKKVKNGETSNGYAETAP